MRTILLAAFVASLLVVGCASEPPPAPRAPPARGTGPSRVRITEPQIAPVQGASEATAPPPAPGGPTPEQEAARIRVRLLQEVEGHYAELTQCFDRGREHDGTLQGRVVVRFTVAPSGDVIGLTDPGGSTMPDRDVVACVQGAFTRMKFGAWDGKAVTAVLPIDFIAPE